MMESTVFIRIYQVRHSDIPVFQALSNDLKVCGKFTIESMREECDNQDPSLLHLHVTVCFNRRDEAWEAINRYNNTWFMNRYKMKVAFYRPSVKQNCTDRDKSQETDRHGTNRISSKEKRVSNSNDIEDKIIERKRSPPYKRSPLKQRKRQSSSSSDSPTSSTINYDSSCKDIRSRLSAVVSKASMLPRRSEHTSRSRARCSYKGKAKQAIKRRVRVVSNTSNSETTTTPVTSGTDSRQSSLVDKPVRKLLFIPRSTETDKNISDVLRPITDNDLTLKANPKIIAEQRIGKETKVDISPIKFGHGPVTNMKTKFQEARKLVVAKSRYNSRRIVSLTPSQTYNQTLPSNKMAENELLVEIDQKVMNSDCISSLNSSMSNNSENIPETTDPKSNTILADNNAKVPNKIRKIKFNIKNSSMLVKDYKMIQNPLESNKQCSPENIKTNPEDIMPKRKRNKSELSTPSIETNILSTSSGHSRASVQKQKLYKSKSFQSYEVADGYNPKVAMQPVITPSVPKQFQAFYHDKLMNSAVSESSPLEVQQTPTSLPLKIDDPRRSITDDIAENMPSERLVTPTTERIEANITESKDHKSNDSDSDNLSTTSISFIEDISIIDTRVEETANPVEEVMHSIDLNQTSVSPTDKTLPTAEDPQRQTANTHSFSPIRLNECLSNKVPSSSSSILQSTNPSVSTATTSVNKMTVDFGGYSSENTIALNHENLQKPQGASCKSVEISISQVNTAPKCANAGLPQPQDVAKDSTIQNLCCQQNIGSKCGSEQNPETVIGQIEYRESPISVLLSNTPLQQMDTVSTETIESVNKLKRPISGNKNPSREKINTDQPINPAKRQKQADRYMCSLVKPHQMSFLLGEKEKLEKLYNEECRTVCNVVQLLLSQDPSLEEHVEKSLSQTLENIGEKYICKLQETVLELCELET